MKASQVFEVPRETTEFSVRPLLFRADMREATAKKVKRATRRIVTANNSKVQPGKFDGLDLDSGRARTADPPELRARCQFESGDVRVVSVTPVVKKGDLFWVKASRFASRAASNLTVGVLSVGVCRVQDMTDADAIEEGVELVKLPKKLEQSKPTPRERFAWLWDSINGTTGPDSWTANPWVWVYQYATFTENVDDLLARWERNR